MMFGIVINGSKITKSLRDFNEWRDDFLIELSTLMLMAGFVAGTVDVFTQGILSILPVFNIAWAIVQATAIDGLFFAVWGRIAKTQWTWATLFHNTMLIIVGLLLAVVATLVNGILSYQELMAIANAKMAMAKLGVDQVTFTYTRSILVVIVAILVALFCRSHNPKKEATQAEIASDSAAIATKRRSHSPRKVVVTEATHSQSIAIPEQSTVDRHSLEDVHSQATEDGSSHDHVTNENGFDEMATDSQSLWLPSTGSHRDRIRMVMQEAIATGQEVSYVEVSRKANVGYSTVKKWASEIKKELGVGVDADQ